MIFSDEFRIVDLKSFLAMHAVWAGWRAVLLGDESTGKQLIAVLNEFGKKTTGIVCSVNCGFLIDKCKTNLCCRNKHQQRPSRAEQTLALG